jgi:hypothetical protein
MGAAAGGQMHQTTSLLPVSLAAAAAQQQTLWVCELMLLCLLQQPMLQSAARLF